MSKLRKLVAISALTALTGCFNVTYISRTRQPAAAVHDQNLNFFLVGLIGQHDIQAGQICPTGIAKVHSQSTGVDVLLTIVTLGIYSPRTVHITCAQ
jgi:hypothetical protein